LAKAGLLAMEELLAMGGSLSKEGNSIARDRGGGAVTGVLVGVPENDPPTSEALARCDRGNCSGRC
jgi:hypothetical protein